MAAVERIREGRTSGARSRPALCLLLCLVSCAERAPEEPVRFENVRIEEIAPERAVVRFDTTRPTACEIEYGTSEAELVLTASDPDMEEGELSLGHEVELEDLTPATQYFLRARVVDAWKRVTRSEVATFETAEPGEIDRRPNWALLSAGATVKAVSSNWGGGDNDSSFGADKAFDGQMSSEWSSDGDGDGAFIEVELDEAKTIDTIAYRSREMSDGSSIVEQVEFELGPMGVTVGPVDTPDPTVRYQLEFEPIAGVETVRMVVLKSTGGNTGARELEVYGP